MGNLGPGRLLSLAVGLVLPVVALRPMQDPDFWWHLATGRWIIDHLRLPQTDLFTFGAAGHPWVLHEWAFEVLLAAWYQAGGLPAVSLVLGAVALAGLLLVWAAMPRGLAYPVNPMLIALGALATAPILGPRVQMFTFTFSALTLLWLRRHHLAGSRWLWLLPLLLAAWANLHGGFLVAFLWLAIALVAEIPGAVASDELVRGAARTRLGRLLKVTLLCLGAACLTPAGPRLLLYPLSTLASPVQQGLIQEWSSPDFHDPHLWPLALLLAGGAALLCAWRRPRVLDGLLFAATALLALDAYRHIPLFVAASLPGLAAAADDLWQRRAFWAGPGPSGRRPLPLMSLVGWLALLVVLIAVTARVAPSLTDRAQRNALAVEIPVGNAAYLATLPPGRVLNDYGFGGYLAWTGTTHPGHPIYVFGDAALMGDPLLSQYQVIFHLRPGWPAQLRSLHAAYVLVARDSPLASVLPATGGWHVAASDPASVLLEPGACDASAAGGSGC
ncbi:MAG: hypothetical protein ACYDAY_07015 [Candidatus Dormibacteria bacterium]